MTYRWVGVVGFLIVSILGAGSASYALTAEEILDKVDKNFEYEAQISEGTLIVHSRRGTRTIRAKTIAAGRQKAFTEYLSPPREKGTKMLKVNNDLWIYTPMADRVIKLSGHMLKQSVMGSDLSYEDFLEPDQLRDAYHAKVIGEEKLGTRDCKILELTAKTSDVAYAKRQIWVDMERFLALKENRYGKGGKLLKTTEIKTVFWVQGRWYPKYMVFKDVLKSGDGTGYRIDTIQFDPDIPTHIFTKASLRR